jgi:hypothetical protein
MLNTYIKNRGLTQTLLHKNNRNHFNETNWDADYDGNIANISVTSNTDGNKNTYNVTLDNEDLANILNVPSVSMPIDKRLQMDFSEPSLKIDPRILQIQVPDLTTSSRFTAQPDFLDDADNFQSAKPTNYLSSPLSNEELIVPITIDEKTQGKYTLTPHRRHMRNKTHKTYKVYKKRKSPDSSKSKAKGRRTKTKSKEKTKSKTSQKFSLF